MYKGKSILAVIPARGGSKGLPGKNIKKLCGKPLIAWSIEQAKNSKYLDKIIVSTDDKNIAEVAKEHGAEVPFLRPAKLANDLTPTVDVLVHLINYLESRKVIFDALMLLEPTSPLRDVKDIDNSIIELFDSNADSVVSVSEVQSTHPNFLVKIDSNNDFIIPYIKNFKVKRRQDLEKLYFFEGSVYIAKISIIKQKKTFYTDKTIAHIMPKWKSFEIDDYVDFLIVETLMKNRNSLYN